MDSSTLVSDSLSWEQVKEEIAKAFSTENVDIDHVKALLSAYKSNKDDWIRFAYFDKYKYTRNLVDDGNERYNILILCWGEGLGKILDGELKETRYSWPVKTADEIQPMKQTYEHNMTTNDVAYINTIGLHRVENTSHTDPAVSLHVYCPPIRMCKAFEERTGQSYTCNVTFYSKAGTRVPVL
ncbi:hypothetical protein EMCRGX_G030649 [Ephydatia muelleri]